MTRLSLNFELEHPARLCPTAPLRVPAASRVSRPRRKVAAPVHSDPGVTIPDPGRVPTAARRWVESESNGTRAATRTPVPRPGKLDSESNSEAVQDHGPCRRSSAVAGASGSVGSESQRWSLSISKSGYLFKLFYLFQIITNSFQIITNNLE